MREEMGGRITTRSDASEWLRTSFRDFGIKPFGAMLGSLKNKPEVLACRRR